MDQSQIDNQLFHMFDGSFKAAKDLQVGDELMGVDSLPCTIEEIDTAEEISYLVKPVKGDSYIVGESDTLSLSFSSANSISSWDTKRNSCAVTYFDRYELKATSVTFSVKSHGNKEKALEAAESYRSLLDPNKTFPIRVLDYMDSTKTFKHCAKGFKVSLNFPERHFPIDPYFIGYWLGDGSSGDCALTIGDEDYHMVEYFEEYFEDNFDLEFNKVGSGITYRVTTGEHGHSCDGKNVVLRYLRDKNLYKNKHIPIEFLHSSRESRLRLLAGLLDSDGSLNYNTCYDFVQKREKLLDDVLYLARSLGFACYKQKCRKTCTNSLTKATGDYFRCGISGKGMEEIPCMIPRKKVGPREQIKDVLVTGIELEDIGVFDNYHIYTDKPEYLLADFTVRHSHEI